MNKTIKCSHASANGTHVYQAQTDPTYCMYACAAMVIGRLNNQEVSATDIALQQYELMIAANQQWTGAGNIKELKTALKLNGILAITKTTGADGDGSVGQILRNPPDGYHKFPVMALCDVEGQSKWGHWVVVDGRESKLVGSDNFCVLDPLLPEMHKTFAIPKTGPAMYTGEFKKNVGQPLVKATLTLKTLVYFKS